LHINPIKEKERSRNFPCARRPTARPLRTRASRLSSTCVSTTCTSRQRAPLGHVRLSSTCTSRQLSQVLSTRAGFSSTSHCKQLPLTSQTPHTLSPFRLSQVKYSDLRFLHTSAPQHVLCHVRLALFSDSTLSVLLDSTSAFSTRPHSDVPRSLLGALHPCPPIARTRHPSPCRFSFQKQADEDDAHLLLRRSARAFRRDISPPPRRVSILPAGSVTTRCTFDGECRWWCVLL